MAEKNRFFSYKGKPLVRSGDLLYFGDMRDNYVVRIQVKSKKPFAPANATGDDGKNVKELLIADKAFVPLVNTDINVSPQKAIVKSSELPSLFDAIDTGYVWLQQALREN